MAKYIFKTLCTLAFIVFFCSMDGPKLKKMKVAEGITAKIPVDFIAMSDDDIAVKYPSTKRPLAMYSSGDRQVDFGLNVTKSNWAGKDMGLLKDIYKSTLYTLYSDVQIIQDTIKYLNKNHFIVLEFTSKIDQTKKYTYMQYGIFNGKVYIFNFTAPEKDKAVWQPVAAEMMASIKVNPGKLQDVDYNPSMATPVKGKRPKEILEHQKSKPSPKTTKSTSK